MSLERVARARSFDGWVESYRHASSSTGTAMRFAIYLPPTATAADPAPLLYFLSGLTCTEETFLAKAGAQRFAAEHGIALVAPDTSPRDTGIAGESGDWEFGAGAGFWLDATAAPWSAHFRMETYVTQDLPSLLAENFPVDPARSGIFGHSMGGHGALALALRNPGIYRSVSAFAPICAASRVPWGQKALPRYLGPDENAWREHDVSALVGQRGGPSGLPFLVDQGLDDKFLATQLRPELLSAACASVGHPLELRRHPGYDHSYFFIATFIGDHLAWHARALR